MAVTTVDPGEVAKFEAMAAEWWDPNGKFKPLHMLNPCRLDYITSQIAAEFGRDLSAPLPFQGLRILDIGCGSGQFTVELAKKTKKVVGLDFSEKMLNYASANATAEGLKNTEFIHSDWDHFHYTEPFDLVIASMSPAIHKPDHLYKMMAYSRGYCYLSSFVERHSSLKEKLYRLTDQSYVRQFNKINYIFNLLWTKGVFPELTYETGIHKRVFPLAKAQEIYTRELSVLESPEQASRIHQYLEAIAENEVVTESLQQRKGELIWKES